MVTSPLTPAQHRQDNLLSGRPCKSVTACGSSWEPPSTSPGSFPRGDPRAVGRPTGLHLEVLFLGARSGQHCLLRSDWSGAEVSEIPGGRGGGSVPVPVPPKAAAGCFRRALEFKTQHTNLEVKGLES